MPEHGASGRDEFDPAGERVVVRGELDPDAGVGGETSGEREQQMGGCGGGAGDEFESVVDAFPSLTRFGGAPVAVEGFPCA